MIRIKISTETLTDLLFVKNHPTVCTTGLNKNIQIVDISLKDNIITCLLEDGNKEITDLTLTHENPLYEIVNHISKYK